MNKEYYKKVICDQCRKAFWKRNCYIRRRRKHNFCCVRCRANYCIGKKCHTEEFKKALAERGRNRIWTSEQREHLRIVNSRWRPTTDQRRKMSIVQKERWKKIPRKPKIIKKRVYPTIVISGICEYCGKYFTKTGKNYGRKAHKLFCSKYCHAIYCRNHQKSKDTDIELKLERILKNNNIIYKKQYNFPQICICDFYLPKRKLAVFCDGEYWHNYPYGKDRDRAQVKKLKEMGVRAIRIWGKIIEKSKDLNVLKMGWCNG